MFAQKHLLTGCQKIGRSGGEGEEEVTLHVETFSIILEKLREGLFVQGRTGMATTCQSTGEGVVGCRENWR